MDIVEKVYTAPAVTDVLDAPSGLLCALMIHSVCQCMTLCFSEFAMFTMFTMFSLV